MDLLAVIRTSAVLAEKCASSRHANHLRERQAIVDFGAFHHVKRAGLNETLSLVKRPLAWGLGLGLPALGVGHALISDAHGQAKDLVRDARNQALLAAAGIGGMQSLGGLLQSAMARPRAGTRPELGESVDPGLRIAADMRVDDLLEDACREGTSSDKRAALVHLVGHRVTAMDVIRRLVL